MNRLFQWLGLCEHVWKQIEKLEVSSHLPSDPIKSKVVKGYSYICQCQKCGKIKSFNV